MEGIKGNLGYLRSGGTDEDGTPAVFSVEIKVTNDISGGISESWQFFTVKAAEVRSMHVLLEKGVHTPSKSHSSAPMVNLEGLL